MKNNHRKRSEAVFLETMHAEDFHQQALATKEGSGTKN